MNKNMVWVRRVVLMNGTPVGKGRPGKDEQKSRTCVFIPLKETYGSHTMATAEQEYNPSRNDSQRKQFKRTSLKNLTVINTGVPKTDVTTPVESVAVNAPAAETLTESTEPQDSTPMVEAPAETQAIA